MNKPLFSQRYSPIRERKRPPPKLKRKLSIVKEVRAINRWLVAHRDVFPSTVHDTHNNAHYSVGIVRKSFFLHCYVISTYLKILSDFSLESSCHSQSKSKTTRDPNVYISALTTREPSPQHNETFTAPRRPLRQPRLLRGDPRSPSHRHHPLLPPPLRNTLHLSL